VGVRGDNLRQRRCRSSGEPVRHGRGSRRDPPAGAGYRFRNRHPALLCSRHHGPHGQPCRHLGRARHAGKERLRRARHLQRPRHYRPAAEGEHRSLEDLRGGTRQLFRGPGRRSGRLGPVAGLHGPRATRRAQGGHPEPFLAAVFGIGLNITAYCAEMRRHPVHRARPVGGRAGARHELPAVDAPGGASNRGTSAWSSSSSTSSLT